VLPCCVPFCNYFLSDEENAGFYIWQSGMYFYKYYIYLKNLVYRVNMKQKQHKHLKFNIYLKKTKINKLQGEVKRYVSVNNLSVLRQETVHEGYVGV
jgi:hypothetical protein